MRAACSLLVLAAALSAVLPSSPAWAQNTESQVLREAAARESVGDYRGAEGLLRTALDSTPTSAGALFALERVLRAQGRVEGVLPYADRFLEADPGSTGPRYLKLRVLVEIDALEEVRAEGQRWIRHDPTASEPYREVARVLDEVLGSEAAEPILEEGMARADRGYDLGLDLGDLRFRGGDYAGAGEAWAAAVGPAGENGPAVIRRVSRLERERAEVLEPMISALGGEEEPPGRRRVATQLALEGGLAPETLALAESVVAELDPAGQRAFLTELSRQSEERRVDAVTLWALRGLRETSTVESEELALDRRIGEVALLVGDTAAALESWRSAASGLREGSPERRRTLAQALRVETERAGVDAGSLSRALDAFKGEFPDAAELDALAAAVSVRLQAEGDLESAGAAVRGVDGPLSALERAYLTLSGDDPAAARDDLVTAVSGLPAGRATDVIALVAFLDRSSPRGCAVAARTTLLAHRGAAAEAVAEVSSGREGLPPGEQAGLLAMAGRIASERGMPREAEEAWRTLLTEFPEASEAPEAALALAVSRASDPEGRAEAITLLEELIVTRPNSPIVPAARLELDRIRSMGGAS